MSACTSTWNIVGLGWAFVALIGVLGLAVGAFFGALGQRFR